MNGASVLLLFVSPNMTSTLPRKDLHSSILMLGFIRRLLKCTSANIHA